MHEIEMSRERKLVFQGAFILPSSLASSRRRFASACKDSISFFKALTRKDAWRALGIHRSSIMRIPAPIEPKSIGIREVSNFQNRNLITMGGVAEFCTAKMATKRMIMTVSQRKICMGFVLGSFPPILPKVRIEFKGNRKRMVCGKSKALCSAGFRTNLPYRIPAGSSGLAAVCSPFSTHGLQNLPDCERDQTHSNDQDPSLLSGINHLQYAGEPGQVNGEDEQPHAQ